MLILTIRTDQPEAILGLWNNTAPLHRLTWLAHRQLSVTIHTKIQELLAVQAADLSCIGAIVVYKGPGSFTGLRIGISVANALAESLSLAIVGSSGKKWDYNGIKRLIAGENERLVLPDYGAPPHITQPRH